MKVSPATMAITMIASVIFKIFQFLYAKFLGLVCRKPAKTLPSITDSILIESASSLAERIREEKLTSEEVVRAFVSRTMEVHDILNCIVAERFEDALEEAKKADEVIRSGTKSKEEIKRDTPLLGVPFTVKCTIAVRGLPTAGAETPAVSDADAVSLLRQAGAIPLACTSASEACFSVESESVDFGRTENPYDTNRTVGASSGGEACLVAAAGTPLGLACGFKGCIRIPAAFAGIFGHKPSADICLRNGSHPDRERASMSCYAVGPMSKSADDLLLALRVMSLQAEPNLKLEEPVDLKQLKYYFTDDNGGYLATPLAEEVKDMINKTANHFKARYGVEVKRVSLRKMQKALHIWKAKIDEEYRGHTLQALPHKTKKPNSCSDKCRPSSTTSQQVFGFLLAVSTKTTFGFDAKTLSKDLSELLKELQDMLGNNGVLICPTQPTPAFLHNESPSRGFDLGYAAVFNALGLPATHCPAGLDTEGLPIGVQVVGAMLQDRLTIAVAREIEKVFGGWKPPPSHGAFTLRNAVLRPIDGELCVTGLVASFQASQKLQVFLENKSCWYSCQR